MRVRLGKRDGQSTIEYVCVLVALFFLLGMGRGVFSELGDTLKNKYRSYLFGIAISDPPEKGGADLLGVGGLRRLDEDVDAARPPTPRMVAEKR